MLKTASTLEEFWDLAHSRADSWWTSGTPFERVRDAFSLEGDLAQRNVLVIGVGRGTELFGFRAAGAHASGLDISEEARTRFAGEFSMFSQETITGTFDLMVMHLVAQHMSDEALVALLAALEPHLSTKGELHIQFACPIHPRQAPGAAESATNLMGGGRTREILEILALAEKSFTVTDLRVIAVFPEHRAYHLAATLSRT